MTSVIDGGLCGLCGLVGTVGRRAAFLVRRTEGEWGPWQLEEVSADLLRRGTLPLPEPNGTGQPAFVAGGHFGVVRSAILDSRGRTIRYGPGRGAVTDLSVCPGGRVLAELIRSEEAVSLALRRLPSLTPIREVVLGGSGYGERVVCGNRSGSVVLASVVSYETHPLETRLLRITPIGQRVLERAEGLAFDVRDDGLFVSCAGGRLVVRNLRVGTRTVVGTTGDMLSEATLSPDGRFLAGFGRHTLVVVDLARSTTARTPWSDPLSGVAWMDRETLAAWSVSGRVETFGPRLRSLHASQWVRAHTFVAKEGRVFGVDWSGALLTEKDGFIVPLGNLFSPAVRVLAPL